MRAPIMVRVPAAFTTIGPSIQISMLVGEAGMPLVALLVRFCTAASAVIDALEKVIKERGAPGHIRSDNGPEFVAKAVKEWLAKRGTQTLFVEPGSPWENGYIESLKSRLRDELLNRQLFSGLKEARVILGEHRRWYNEGRIHSGIG